ncbi:MAG: inositol monophosphatase family protein [Bryobacteraceae bacterium]
MGHWDRELEIAEQASRAAAELATRYQPGIQAESKADLSPVTHADRECELLMSRLLSEAFPEDGLLGEEGARVESSSGRRWIIDPIDGTRDYVRGNPLWANLIALEAGGEVVVGVVNLPVLGGLYSASKGFGAYRNGLPIHASLKVQITDSVLCVNAINKLAQTPFRDRLLDWAAPFWAVRSLGGAPDAMLIASGQAEVWIEPVAAAWDLAPLKIIIEEAGGVFMNFDGRSSIYGGNGVACAPGLHASVRAFLGL